jgi:hypothetical protein
MLETLHQNSKAKLGVFANASKRWNIEFSDICGIPIVHPPKKGISRFNTELMQETA